MPKLEYLLGMILAQEHAYPEATAHIQNYLRVATQPSDIADAQKWLITRVSASATPPPASEEKK